ncbi:MAG: hypothetical protein ACOYN2_03900 [Patescibacteria group bacterium]
MKWNTRRSAVSGNTGIRIPVAVNHEDVEAAIRRSIVLTAPENDPVAVVGLAVPD